MKRLSLLLFFLAICGGRLSAQTPDRALDRLSQPLFPKTAEAPHLAVLRQASGDPILVVDYPWAVHADASVEIRLLVPGEREANAWQPVFFVANYLDATALKSIYRCQDLGENLPTKITFGKTDIDFEILGQRNSLEHSAVTIGCKSKLEGPRAGVRAIFWPLKEWALDRDTLYLEMPKKGFSLPCQIRVWFLRKDQVIWGETFAWPGYPKKPDPLETPEKKPEPPGG